MSSRSPLPPRHGIPARRVVLRGTVDPAHRYLAGRAGDSPFAFGQPIPPGTVLDRPQPAWYYPELGPEPKIPFHHTLIHADADLLVVDKPPFLPTTSNGRLVRNTLQTRLRLAYGQDCVPIHRLDRLTSGIVLCSRHQDTRGAYQRLFQLHRVSKRYLARVSNPHLLPTSWTRIDAPMARIPAARGVAVGHGRPTTTWLRRRPGTDLVDLRPITGHTHQLRAVLNHLGSPIRGDDTYPEDLGLDLGDFSHVLQLRAIGVSLVDPLSNQTRTFAVPEQFPRPGSGAVNCAS
ncbi:pseudouridine synthase [Corynebacterium uberis]|uniref:pseudouridine synthase n=1 Tax=Corynebacterium TaxID=1716 RepID=UPI001D0BC3A7|nr:pseudouridine synthase [Corynebacterium uberis]MCZ9308946.1 pseudouridine synthase [Corynebacterium sp. c6VSa_13]UDL74583.1 pseudouridine synthase [Corynebacterium uberis]UDL76583.1 pseudouridine synthase [Corynebacterium uberis]UDL78796.1 pseudouridine synthase [Corynebacterium uberis]UDL81074.1 pseudouridine synthase [Corynebacterium uberis]